jgi:thioesterase domain-containing protein
MIDEADAGRGVERSSGGAALPGRVEAYLHERIPLSLLMGVTVEAAGDDGVRLAAPLEPNLNHRGTGFGGSLSALAILAGWSTVWVGLRSEPAAYHIVIAENTVVYTAPAEGALRAECGAPDPALWERFVRTARARGRARIELTVEVTAAGRGVATFRGVYVALRADAGEAAVAR